MQGASETKELVCGCICIAMFNIIFSMGYGAGSLHLHVTHQCEMERPGLNIAYYMFFVLYNFFGTLRLVWRKENCIPVWIALGVFNIFLHLFPSCLTNYDMWYLVPNWIYFIIQVLSICLLLDTFLYLRTKNNFNRNMLERRCRSSQREVPTPHTHYIPRGFQDHTKDARDEVKTPLKSDENKKEVHISINNEKSQSIYVVDN